MPSAIAILPRVNAYPHACPIRCPYCGCDVRHMHGEVQKRVKGVDVADVGVGYVAQVGWMRIGGAGASGV